MSSRHGGHELAWHFDKRLVGVFESRLVLGHCLCLGLLLVVPKDLLYSRLVPSLRKIRMFHPCCFFLCEPGPRDSFCAARLPLTFDFLLTPVRNQRYVGITPASIPATLRSSSRSGQ